LDTANYTLDNTAADLVILGNGTSVVTLTNTNSADNTGEIKQAFYHSGISPILTLTNVGDSITLAGTVIMTGSVSGNEQFRLGLVQQGTNTSDTNWLGYFFENANTTASGAGNLDVRQNPNQGVYTSGTGATTLASPAVPGGTSFGAGTYQTSISVTLLASNWEQVQWTLTNGTYNQTGSIINTNTTNNIAGVLTFDSVGLLLGSSYDGTSCVFSNLTVTYAIAPPGITISPEPVSETVALGQPASFTVSATGSSPAFQWYTCSDLNYDNPSPIPGATNNVYSIASTVATNSTNYFVIASNSTSTAESTIATLTVRLTVNTLAWLGSAGANWDTTTANWSNTVSSASPVAYIPGDMVNFTDSGNSAAAIAVVGTLLPDSVTVSSSSNYTIGTGVIGGGTGVTKSGTGTLILNGANTFTGTVSVNNGIVQMGNPSALGAAAALVSVNGGTVDVHGVAAPANAEFLVQGTGYTNGGTIQNFGTANSQNGNGIAGLVLAGDATIGASTARWDLNGDAAGGAKLQGNHHNLTKVGANQIWLVDANTNNGLSNITITAGTLGFQGTTDLGDPAGTVTVYSNAVLGFYAVPTNIGLGLQKNIVLSNGDINLSITNYNLIGPVTVMGTNNQATLASGLTVNFDGPISGSGGWLDATAGSVVLNGTNTYTGPTFVNSGTLTLGANASLASSLIQVAGGATLNASLSGLKLGAGQTLVGGAGADQSSVLGNVTNGAGSTIGAGVSGPGYLSIGSSLTLSGATNIVTLGANTSDTTGATSSYLYTSGTLTLSGVNTLLIVPNATLATNGPYTVMEADGGFTGTAANLRAVTTNPRLTASVVSPLSSTAPYIEVNIAGAAGQLLWKGGAAGNPTVWDHSTSNWFNTVSSAADVFYDGDTVTFNDTANTNLVTIFPERSRPGARLSTTTV
jgi:autotransporter-associated beta strand protein